MRGLKLNIVESKGLAVLDRAMRHFSGFNSASLEFSERCGGDATLVVGNDWFFSKEDAVWGTGLGHVKVRLFPINDLLDDCLMAFEVGFRAVDDDIFSVVHPKMLTSVARTAPLADQVILLATIHLAAKYGMANDCLAGELNRMATIDAAAIEKLKG